MLFCLPLGTGTWGFRLNLEASHQVLKVDMCSGLAKTEAAPRTSEVYIPNPLHPLRFHPAQSHSTAYISIAICDIQVSSISQTQSSF
ncbi:hypothetical protein VTJ04DRAFT_8241 [Mycothermus thermophilus]|uniref:uncharacterized protein n=1 Tax=Humicola insolens TaxID=85995 RepID=UPI003742248C